MVHPELAIISLVLFCIAFAVILSLILIALTHNAKVKREIELHKKREARKYKNRMLKWRTKCMKT